MIERVILVVGFRTVEALERNYLGDDRLAEDLGGVELGDVVGGDLLLPRIGEEDR